ncbi:MAG: EF-P lysine aminoacylase GenX [Bdellovibrionales bacterium]|nr:EF-P lysine aminoacylase GenX [Bdellovibrionales bacterium]
MTSANFITAREQFMAHHWLRYPSMTTLEHREHCIFGRVLRRDYTRLIFSSAEELDLTTVKWMSTTLLHPNAQEMTPPVGEVIAIGDWVAFDRSRNLLGLLAPNLLRPSQGDAELSARAVNWAAFLKRVRDFFWSQQFIEVSTPTLAPSPGTEPFLDPLSVRYEFGADTQTRYLITSPEFHLKKVLAAGVPKVFEIAKCFRNKEGGQHHRIEFHMLEWYRAFSDLSLIADDVERLIQVFSPEAKLARVSVRELFSRYADFDLAAGTTREELGAHCRRVGIHTHRTDDFNDLFHRVWLEQIEGPLETHAQGNPVLVEEYPPALSALARIGQSGFAERFEVYWRGLELCNAFHELNDPRENRKRFERDLAEKRHLGKDPVPLDEELLKAFEAGMPPSGGIALGLERLYMAVHGIADIGQVAAFSAMV